MSTITAQIQLRRDTSANWTSNNPILLAGEMALSTDVLYSGTDQPRYKIGNGIDTWLNLDYIPESGGGSSYPENLYLTVVNKTGDNLLASGYKVLKVQTAQGQRLAVDYALADSDANSADTIGVVYENINNNQTGKIVVIGELTGLNTTGSLQGETWDDGDLLFLSPFVDGGITNIRPTAPNHGVIIGYVVYSHVNQGKIYIKIDNGYEIGELHNCYLPTPTHNDGIFWSSGTTRYENKSITTVLGYTPAPLYTFELYTDTSNVNPADASVYYSGSLNNFAPETTNTIPFKSIKNNCIYDIYVTVFVRTTLGSTENSTVKLQNITKSTEQTLGTIKHSERINQLYFRTSLANTLNDNLIIQITNPNWATNPISVMYSFNIKGY
jgi:hypothetical protein